MKRRLLLAVCTFAVAVGAGVSLALPAVLEQSHAVLHIDVPGDVTAHLDPGRYVFEASGSDLPLEESRPVCTALRDRAAVRVVPETDSGFAAMRVTAAGDHQVACSAAVEGMHVTVTRTTSSRSARILRAALLTLVLTALAALLAARPLVILRAQRGTT